jgi:NADP-dependent 3-hydroxy acid dehydrogenase YdfG
MNHDFTGKVALITGTSGGIGLATARTFADRGASVVLSARRTELIEAEAKRLTDAGHTASPSPQT